MAQDQKIADSCSLIYNEQTLPDSSKLKLLQTLSFNEVRDLRKGLSYANELIAIAQRLGDSKYLRIGYFLKGNKYRMMGELDSATNEYIKSAEIARISKYPKGEGETYGAIADIYATSKNFRSAHLYYNKSIEILRSISSPSTNDSISLATLIFNKGDAFLTQQKFDSALHYFFEAKAIFDKTGYLSGIGYSLGNIGMVYANLDRHEMAEQNIIQAIRILEEAQDYYPICVYLVSMSDIYHAKNDTRKALKYANRSLELAKEYNLKQEISNASLRLSEIYQEFGDHQKALDLFKTHVLYRDSILNIPALQKMADDIKNYEVSRKQLEVDLAQQQKRSQQNLLVALAIILVLTIVMLGIILRNDQHKKKAYKVLNLQKKKTDEQKERAETALAELKEAQKQLIQSAKMASLGELTAGIAHEIQNPLNFVNNFSEISTELLEELKAATDKQEANELANELDSNLKKIALHGKRAESIVKNMLQHSRMRSGQYEPTDINNLIEEFLQLSYSGIRAVDKNFNARFDTQLDPTIGKVDMIPQDIGRVFLNIFQNAFYAVDKRKREENSSYQPHVSVSSRKLTDQDKVEIVISDNGTGIPENVLDKIFQPFFTTKPTGQGTGLGLWLSYDIIKAHNGDISVESSNGEYTRFTIALPIHRLTGKMAE